MRVVECASSNDGINATAFLSAKHELVVHVVNNTDAPAPVQLNIAGSAAPATRQRTSATEDAATLSPLPISAGGYSDTVPARSLTTYQLTVK